MFPPSFSLKILEMMCDERCCSAFSEIFHVEDFFNVILDGRIKQHLLSRDSKNKILIKNVKKIKIQKEF
jgi:hypothetical protein